MYIEAAELSERHADIKFQCPLQIQSQNSLEYETEFARKGQYVLKDCNSQSGTWTKIPNSFASEQNGMLINLHESLDRIFKVDLHQFVFELDPTRDSIDEVASWLQTIQSPNLAKALEENQMNFKSMRQLAEIIDISFLEGVGLP